MNTFPVMNLLDEDLARLRKLMSYPARIVPGTRNRYLPAADVIEYSGNPVILAHEQGHRQGVLTGRIPATLTTRQQEVDAETYAWRYAAEQLRRQGLWNDEAKRLAAQGLAGHGIYWDNYVKLNALVSSL